MCSKKLTKTLKLQVLEFLEIEKKLERRIQLTPPITKKMLKLPCRKQALRKTRKVLQLVIYLKKRIRTKRTIHRSYRKSYDNLFSCLNIFRLLQFNKKCIQKRFSTCLRLNKIVLKNKIWCDDKFYNKITRFK